MTVLDHRTLLLETDNFPSSSIMSDQTCMAKESIKTLKSNIKLFHKMEILKQNKFSFETFVTNEFNLLILIKEKVLDRSLWMEN